MDPAEDWWEKRHALQTLSQNRGPGPAFCGHLLQESADTKSMVARLHDISGAVTVDMVESRAVTVQHRSFDSVLQVPVSNYACRVSGVMLRSPLHVFVHV